MKQYLIFLLFVVSCHKNDLKIVAETDLKQPFTKPVASAPVVVAPETKPAEVAPVSVPASIPVAKPTPKEKPTGPVVDISLVADGLYQVESFIESEDCKKTKKRKDMPFLRAKKEEGFMGKMLELSACKSKTSCDKTYAALLDEEGPTYSSFSDGASCELSRTTYTLTVKDATLTIEKRMMTLPPTPGACPETGEIGVAFEKQPIESARCESYDTISAVKAGNR